MKKYQYEYRRNDRKIKTQWNIDKDVVLGRMEKRPGTLLHHTGKVAGDGDSAPDGSHPGCARANGLLSLNVKEAA